jgi:hypothetical protein
MHGGILDFNGSNLRDSWNKEAKLKIEEDREHSKNHKECLLLLLGLLVGNDE